MKKIFLVFLSVFLILTIGCADKSALQKVLGDNVTQGILHGKIVDATTGVAVPEVYVYIKGSNFEKKIKSNSTENSTSDGQPNKTGYYSAEEFNEVTSQKKAAPKAVLLDPDGDVGRMYDAKTTPHMFIINADGILVYNGAIDDKPTSSLEDVETAKNYVKIALDEMISGKEVSTPFSQPYGCSVKYKSSK